MQISRRDALIGAGAVAVVAGVPGAVMGEDPVIALIDRAIALRAKAYIEASDLIGKEAGHIECEVPEAKEADKAYEAAYDKTMEAWTTARDTPATTQAGLFAKLQEAVRFMDDLEEGELWEAEWCAIKADVQRVAGEARS